MPAPRPQNPPTPSKRLGSIRAGPCPSRIQGRGLPKGAGSRPYPGSGPTAVERCWAALCLLRPAATASSLQLRFLQHCHLGQQSL